MLDVLLVLLTYGIGVVSGGAAMYIVLLRGDNGDA